MKLNLPTIPICLSTFALASALAFSAFGSALPALYVTPSQGFEVNIIAALEKKQVPVRIISDPASADYVLTPSTVQIHKESSAGKVARCLFAYCAGIEDSGDVSVQLTDTHTKTIVWGYNVAKQRAAKNRQSMAEAIAKHLKNDFLAKGSL